MIALSILVGVVVGVILCCFFRLQSQILVIIAAACGGFAGPMLTDGCCSFSVVGQLLFSAICAFLFVGLAIFSYDKEQEGEQGEQGEQE